MSRELSGGSDAGAAWARRAWARPLVTRKEKMGVSGARRRAGPAGGLGVSRGAPIPEKAWLETGACPQAYSLSQSTLGALPGGVGAGPTCTQGWRLQKHAAPRLRPPRSSDNGPCEERSGRSRAAQTLAACPHIHASGDSGGASTAPEARHVPPTPLTRAHS